jgi:hypothetical protein
MMCIHSITGCFAEQYATQVATEESSMKQQAHVTPHGTLGVTFGDMPGVVLIRYQVSG